MIRSSVARGLAIAVLGAVQVAVPAAAQEDPPLTINPGTRTPPPTTGTRAPAPQGGAPQGGAPAVDQGREGAGGEDTGYYYGTELGEDDREEQSLHHVGQVPDTHVVRRGDTLWDICSYYFNNPWEWPKVWSYNPAITNPHWIYPGDLVRLYPAGEGPVVGDDGGGGAVPNDVGPKVVAGPPAGGGRRTVDLRQVAFVDDKELEVAGTVVGAPEDKELLSTGDEVYLDYPEGKPPQLGQKYAVYSHTKQVKHPRTKAVVGSYITLRGEVKILEVKKDRKARAVILYATDIIERGMRVGPTRTQFKEVAPVAPERDLEGVVVALLNTDEMGAENQVVIIDRGRDDGIKVGNQLRVVRRGDAYDDKMGPKSQAGRDDRDFPEDGLAVIIVVEAGPRSSVAFVVDSKQEIEIGDHVVMRQPK
jgi:hypothetical protein